MRIFDENSNEITEEEVDLEKGYLTVEQIFKEHHDAIEAEEEKGHYTVDTWFFSDGTSYTCTGEDDPHIKVVDAEKGIFDYEDQGEEKTYHGASLTYIVDSAKVDAVEAYDEYETINRYHLYTEEQIQARKDAEEKAAKQAEFMDAGPDQLKANTESINTLTEQLAANVESLDDLFITLADVVAGEDTIESEE